MTVMAGATISPALPAINEYFKATPGADTLSRLVFTIPALFIAIFGSITGYIADRWGRRIVLASSLLLYAISGSAGLYLDSLNSLLVSRALLGIAVAGLLTATTTLIADYFHGDEREKFMGKQAAFIGLGGIVFVLCGGILARFSWRYPFAVYLFSLIALPMVIAFIREQPRTISENLEKEALNKSIEWKSIFGIYILAVIGMILFYLIPVQLPFYLKEITGPEAMFFGIAVAWFTVSSAFGSLQHSKLKRKHSFNAIFALVFVLIGIGYFSLGFASKYWLVLVTLIFSGFGFGLFLPNINILITQIAPVSTRARIVGGLTTSFFLGQFLSPLAAQPVITPSGFDGWNGLYGVSGLFSFLVAIFFLFTIRRKSAK
jgi:MFS family permease